MELNIKWGKEFPAYFVVAEGDIDTILYQMKRRKFNSNLVLGVAARCLYGKPQVILCKSLFNGIPFPNSFWLSCPVLVRIAGQLESFGGVKGLEAFIKENYKTDWKAYNKLHTKIRISLADKSELRVLKQKNISSYKNFCDNNIGIGGIRMNEEINVKCLHLQIASFLSLRFHPGQDWFKERISSFYLNNY